MEKFITITFLRHGRSRADDEEVHEGRYDSPLTDIGRAQAHARAQVFLTRNIGFDQIISSPLQRAFETASMIGHMLNTPVETDPGWMEMDNGPLAGLSMAVAAERYPPPAFRNPYEPFCTTGESDWELYRRAAGAVERVIRRGAGQYLVVAHGGILNAALRSIAGIPPSANHQGLVFGFGDTGYARFVYEPFGHRWHLLEFQAG
jgi:2,3-bisphosphoglycerate-dependent phosphoglycerate mutase